jgi:hypothetical protein
LNLPDVPIAHEGFFATHFFTVRDQEKSKDFYVRILGGKVIKPENPCYIKLANFSRSANMLKSPSTGSTTAVNLASDERISGMTSKYLRDGVEESRYIKGTIPISQDAISATLCLPTPVTQEAAGSSPVAPAIAGRNARLPQRQGR